MFKHSNTKKKKKKNYCTRKTRVMSLILINRHYYLKQKFKYSNTYQFILNRHCGGQLIPEVLFTWKGLGLWPNTQSEDKNISEDDQLRKR